MGSWLDDAEQRAETAAGFIYGGPLRGANERERVVGEDAPRAYALIRQLGEALALTDTDPFSASTADKIDSALAAFREATEDR